MAERAAKDNKMKVWLTKYWLAAGVGLLVIGFVLGLVLNWGYRSFFGTEEESHNTQVVHSLQRDEQIVLLSLGVQGIAEERVSRTVFGATVPGSGRTLFLQYNFMAKLGLEGKNVVIEPKGDDTILIRVPDFTFIGHEDITFKTALEDNGMLSWVTPDIDTPEVISEILSDQQIDEYVASNRDILELQTEMFYEGIIHGVDPDITVLFEFTNSTLAP